MITTYVRDAGRFWFVFPRHPVKNGNDVRTCELENSSTRHPPFYVCICVVYFLLGALCDLIGYSCGGHLLVRLLCQVTPVLLYAIKADPMCFSSIPCDSVNLVRFFLPSLRLRHDLSALKTRQVVFPVPRRSLFYLALEPCCYCCTLILVVLPICGEFFLVCS